MIATDLTYLPVLDSRKRPGLPGRGGMGWGGVGWGQAARRVEETELAGLKMRMTETERTSGGFLLLTGVCN